MQDKSRYHGKQMNVSGSVTVGDGFAAGGSFNKSKVNTDYASVNEQAGIFAGNDGYDINVKNKSFFCWWRYSFKCTKREKSNDSTRFRIFKYSKLF